MKTPIYQKALRHCNEEEIRRLGELPAFQELVEKYGSVREASEEELAKAFRQTPLSHIETVLGLKELDDMGNYPLEGSGSEELDDMGNYPLEGSGSEKK